MSRRTTGRGGDVPLFLQKTYQMIETCPDAVASWSADGRTFVVKDVPQFESSVIPQYFKHSKFSSFVRQLNFYGFRKVKYSDSLRINADEDRATANYWRFRHDLFMRGRKDLLGEIRRNVGQAAPVLVRRVPAVPGSGPSPSGPANGGEEVRELRSEMSRMRYRMDNMARDIDELTGMVKKVSVADDDGEEGGSGSKRKKTAGSSPGAVTDAAPSSATLVVSPGGAVPDAASSSVLPDWDAGADIDMLLSGSDQILPDVAPSSDAGSSLSRSSSTSGVSDEGFVDELYDAFASEGPLDAEPASVGTGTAVAPAAPGAGGSRPDPVIMRRIEDSLSTLPRDMHELVATRLITAIEGAAPPVVDASEGATGTSTSTSGKLDRSISVDADDAVMPDAAAASPSPAPSRIPLPLAVAALKAVLSEYGMKVECTPGDAVAAPADAARGARESRAPSPPAHRASRSPSPAGTVRGYKSKDPLLAKRMGRGLPVVPLHA